MNPFDPEHDILLKVVVIGPSGVGKTSLLKKYCENVFDETNMSATIGIEYKVKTFKTTIKGKEKIIKLQIWDSAGQDRYKDIVKNFFNGAHIVLYVFAVNNTQSLEDLQGWIQLVDELGARCNPETKVLIGNKIDQPNSVAFDRVDALAVQNNMQFIKTSAKTGDNVNEIFETVATNIAASLLENNIVADNKQYISFQQQHETTVTRQEKRNCCGGT